MRELKEAFAVELLMKALDEAVETDAKEEDAANGRGALGAGASTPPSQEQLIFHCR
jgi:hypothetical protein